MNAEERLKAYAKQAGCPGPWWSGTGWKLTAKQRRRYCKKWWREATPQEQAEQRKYLRDWELERLGVVKK